jgi:hypothetical protein
LRRGWFIFFFFFGHWQQKKVTKGGINGGVRYDQLMLDGENAMRIDR